MIYFFALRLKKIVQHIGNRKKVAVFFGICMFSLITVVCFQQYFPGNRDQNTVKSYPLVPNIKTRYIRIMPWHWYGHISMRAEFYGCFAGL